VTAPSRDVVAAAPGGAATTIAAAVRSGAVDAVDVVRAHLDHLAAVEPRRGKVRAFPRMAGIIFQTPAGMSRRGFSFPS
jgi:amidase